MGKDAAARFCASIFRAGRRFRLLTTSANGQAALAAYLRQADGPAIGVGLFTLALRGEQLSAMTRFESRVMPWFGLSPLLAE